jgi:plastocyanin
VRHLGRGLRGAAVLAAAGALAAAAVASAGDAKRITKDIHLGDHGNVDLNYYDPNDPRIHKGDKLHWIWDSDAVLQHSVYLKKAPSGVKKPNFRSPVTTQPYEYTSPRFKVRGTYKFVCAAHPANMKMTVTVRR